MNKRHLHHIWTKFRHVKPWYFLTIMIISIVVAVFALRANNQHMLELRSAVYAADKDSGDTETALRNLQQYVTTHMNTNLSAGKNAVYPPIQLKYTYERLVQSQSGQTADSNQKIYTDAQRICEQQFPAGLSGRGRIPCIQEYVKSHTVALGSANVPDALYKFSFVSPRWSPDLAGWSIVVAIVSGLLFIISLIARRWFKRNIA